MTQLNMYGSCITEISECQVPRVNCQVSSADASHYHQWYKASRKIGYILWPLRVLLLGILLGSIWRFHVFTYFGIPTW